MRPARRLWFVAVLLVPAALAAQSVTVLQNTWTTLTDEEIAALGFDAKLAVDSSGETEARLTITLPDIIEGKKFIDAKTQLFSDDLLMRSFDTETVTNNEGSHMIRINVDLMIINKVKLRLRYTGRAKYEATIKLDGYQTVI